MKNKITLYLITFCLITLCLAACGKGNNQEKLAYKEALTEYYNQISITSVSINNIDVNAPGGTTQLLSLLDTMSVSFTQLAALQPPARYEPLKQLTIDANASFTQANAIYHEIYGDESLANFDLDRATEAAMHYTDAMSKLVQLGKSIMADENPSSVSSSNNTETTPANMTVSGN